MYKYIGKDRESMVNKNQKLPLKITMSGPSVWLSSIPPARFYIFYVEDLSLLSA